MASSTHIAHTLLLKAHPPDLASTIFTDKVLHKPLHLRATSPNPTSQDARAHRRFERLRIKAKSQQKKPKPLSAKQKRISGIYDIPKEGQKYEIYARLHQMWVGYMWEILGMKEGGGMAYLTAQGTGGVLVSADYHGAEVMVVRSRCSGLVGLAGIVVRDTKFTFQVITKDDVLKTIPKKHTVFRFELEQPAARNSQVEGREIGDGEKLPNLVFEIYGSQFENRAADRATKKFKSKYLADL